MQNIKPEDENFIILSDKNYYSNDIDIATTLICKGYELLDITHMGQGKYSFVFKNYPTIHDAVAGFWDNRIEVKPLEFANIRKNLKSRIYGMGKNN